MLVKLRELIAGLQVYPEHMARNLAITKGLYCSQSVLLALTRAGAERKTAYEAVQRAAMRTWKGDESFAANAKAEPDITRLVPADQIDALCSMDTHLRHVDSTFQALGLQ
jgi:adenylosuccinate lyase